MARTEPSTGVVRDVGAPDGDTADEVSGDVDVDGPLGDGVPRDDSGAVGRRAERRARRRDRDRPPRDWRWWVAGTGRILISIGLLLLAFAAYQLWGTAIETAAAQDRLEQSFEERLATVAPPPTTAADAVDPAPANDTVAPSEEAEEAATEEAEVAATEEAEEAATEAEETTVTEPAATPDVTAAVPAGPSVPVPVDRQVIGDVNEGDGIARIEIPRIGVDDIVVAGVGTSELKKGPGHFPNTPFPGQLGNAAIAGHRTTYGQPFFDVDRLRIGDAIEVTTLNGTFTYRVTGTSIVAPSDYHVVSTTDPGTANLTLTSCHPKWTAQQRIVVTSELDPAVSSPVGATVLDYGRDQPTTAPAEIPGDAVDEAPGAPAERDEVAGEGATGDASDPATGDGSVPADLDAPDPVAAAGPPRSGTLAAHDGDAPAEGSDPEVDGGATADEATGARPPAIDSPVVEDRIADAFAGGWFSDPGANPHVGLWGLAVAAIAIAAHAISRRFRSDLVGLAVGVVPFTVALYFFFQNVDRLLPPNL
ncbi:class E sortase [Ilumatobacter sp.]|uniref:class E sortase n=1 Tax=Ilumatobacter sp. TaxID=1967498 RepID=UPI003B52F119